MTDQSSSNAPVLVVDLDGTLTKTDTFVESLIQLVFVSPINILRIVSWSLRGLIYLKRRVAAENSLDPALLPYNSDLIAYLKQEKKRNRRIVLATASNIEVARNVAEYLGLFDNVIATSDGPNLKGTYKLEAIRSKEGNRFSYAGDSRSDLPIWKHAESAILVNTSDSVNRIVERYTNVEASFRLSGNSVVLWFKQIRVYQWSKNTLVLVPIFAGFEFLLLDKLISASLAFLSLSFAASFGYIVNDLKDLNNDRSHPRKRERPLAAGAIDIRTAPIVGLGCLSVSILLAYTVSVGFLVLLLGYLVITNLYSWFLKSYVLIDVVVLSVLYTVRIFAGSVSTDIFVSEWLLAFSVFLFLSLALVKRCAELVSLEGANGVATRGRDYRVSDLRVFWPLGVAFAVSAIVVFGLFANSPVTLQAYSSPQLLWLSALCLCYWLARMWLKTSRGEMHDDPIVFSLRDRGSIVVLAVAATIIVIARFVSLDSIL